MAWVELEQTEMQIEWKIVAAGSRYLRDVEARYAKSVKEHIKFRWKMAK